MTFNIRGPPYMTSAKFSDFFTPPLPPCHCHKSAGFVPFVCFLGTPLPPSTADVIYGSPHTSNTHSWSRVFDRNILMMDGARSSTIGRLFNFLWKCFRNFTIFQSHWRDCPFLINSELNQLPNYIATFYRARHP